MKEGLIFENDELIYYKHGEPYHAGVIQVDGNIYYIGSGGKAVKGQHIVHQVMSNGILKRGTYTFGDDYKLVKGSYIAPKKHKRHKFRIFGKQRSRRKKSTMHSAKKFAKKLLPIVLGILCLVILLTQISRIDKNHTPASNKDIPAESTENTSVRIHLPVFEEDVLLCSKIAKQVYDHQFDIADAVTYGNPYRPFVFQYLFPDISGIFYLSENSDMTDAQEYALPAENTSLVIDNLKTGFTYYYLVKVDGEEHSGSFRTARSNRYISIPDTENIRDIGGYITLDGKLVRQGLLIRGTELDGLVNGAYYPSADGIAQMQDTFGFVYDMDLRAPTIFSGTYRSRWEDNVGHQFYNAPQYGQIFSDTYIPSLRAIFRDLADPEKYPMYLHCTWGRDRTGTIVFLLQGILNVSEQDMLLEYRQTGFTDYAVSKMNSMDSIISGMDLYEGDTLQERIVSFLTQVVGVTEEEIASIRTIFLETPTE